jgi:hypothetical protein
MADQSSSAPGTLQLRPEDIAFLLTLLRNSPAPLTTQQLVDAFKERNAPRGE